MLLDKLFRRLKGLIIEQEDVEIDIL